VIADFARVASIAAEFGDMETVHELTRALASVDR